MNARFVFVIALIVLFVLPLPVIAQDKNEEKKGSASITGCLNKGEDAEHYVIKDEKTGKETVVMGDAALLERHANNHQVTVTGTMAKDKGKDVLKANDLKMIAVCK
jgi:hypothetical protein